MDLDSYHPAEESLQPLAASLEISRQAAPYARMGLTAATAREMAAIIYRIAQVDAVAITDTEAILAYVGDGCPHMRPGHRIQTLATRRALASGHVTTARDKFELDCPIEGCPCPVRSAIIAPLRIGGQTVGTVKLYRLVDGEMPDAARRLALGLSELLSLQLNVAEAEHQRELLAQARVQALEAQIRPHFLFNTLNAVIATSRQDPEQARQMLTELAGWLRHTLSPRPAHILVGDEVELVRWYLHLERARFGDRVAVEFRIDPAVLGRRMPTLTLEPLVENAVVHGLAPKEGPGRMLVAVQRRGADIRVMVGDDGVGMSSARVREIRAGGQPGIGLANVRARLHGLFGSRARFRVRSREGRGTWVSFRVPGDGWPDGR